MPRKIRDARLVSARTEETLKGCTVMCYQTKWLVPYSLLRCCYFFREDEIESFNLFVRYLSEACHNSFRNQGLLILPNDSDCGGTDSIVPHDDYALVPKSRGGLAETFNVTQDRFYAYDRFQTYVCRVSIDVDLYERVLAKREPTRGDFNPLGYISFFYKGREFGLPSFDSCPCDILAVHTDRQFGLDAAWQRLQDVAKTYCLDDAEVYRLRDDFDYYFSDLNEMTVRYTTGDKGAKIALKTRIPHEEISEYYTFCSLAVLPVYEVAYVVRQAEIILNKADETLLSIKKEYASESHLSFRMSHFNCLLKAMSSVFAEFAEGEQRHKDH
jgi:hypothetical protein